MTSTATLAWFARHELTLAWRDWVAMMSGGRTVREHAITIGTLIFVGLLHWLAYAILSPVLANGVLQDKVTLVLLTAILLAAFSMMLSQSIEQVTRAFYSRADLDLILSSPAASQHLFAVRIGAVAFAGTAMTSLLAAPFINMAAYISGVQWLWAYVVIAALSMIATAVSVVGAIALFKAFGPKRTRTIAQIIAAVVGAALLIGLQVAAIFAYGNLSRFTVLRSEAMIGAAPDPASVAWLPAKALLGEPLSLIAFLIFATAILAAAIAYNAGEFANHAVAAASSVDNTNKRSSARSIYKHRTMAQALRAKEWILLRRDPWLASQTLMQVLYLLPPALLLWRDMGPDTKVDVILAPVLVMAFGQLAGGLAWLAISGEDAPELVATAPLSANAVLRAKIEAVLAVIAVCAAPFVLGLVVVSVVSAGLTSLGIIAASSSAIAIQLWFKTAAKRSQFRRRQTASRAATFAEAFCSIFWAAAAGFAVAGYAIPAIAFAIFAIATMAIARGISPST